jgi:hypothetical protein
MYTSLSLLVPNVEHFNLFENVYTLHLQHATPVYILSELHSQGTFGGIFLTLKILKEFIRPILRIIFPLKKKRERERERFDSLKWQLHIYKVGTCMVKTTSILQVFT